jgi:hypothetical protein
MWLNDLLRINKKLAIALINYPPELKATLSVYERELLNAVKEAHDEIQKITDQEMARLQEIWNQTYIGTRAGIGKIE